MYLKKKRKKWTRKEKKQKKNLKVVKKVFNKKYMYTYRMFI
jgi:hypothetical protein